MIEININDLNKSEQSVRVKGYQTSSGYVKPYIRIVKKKSDTESDSKSTSVQAYKDAASRTNDWIKDNPDRSRDVGETNEYCIDSFDVINTALRNDFTDEQLSNMIIGDQIKSISSFLKDAPKFDGTVYRGMSFDIAYGGDKQYEDFMGDADVGGEITLKPFTSTSARKDVAMKFVSKDNINVLMEIKSKRGVALDGAAEFIDEREVLFDKASKFKITDITITGDDVNMKMEEI